MKQIHCVAFGQPSAVCRCVEVPELGPPSAWEVLVAVEAFPINVSDLAILSGKYGTLPKPPALIGMEAVGRVLQCGRSVANVAVGDRVVLLANNNWAERRKLPSAVVQKVSPDADVLQMSMLKVNPATAYSLLHEQATLLEGDWILVTAPLSSAGQCILQIAQTRGYRTVGVVRRPEARARVLELGGSVAVEDGPDLAARVEQATNRAPINLALDCVAGPGINRLAECLTEGGTIINYGMLSGEACVLAAEQTIFRNISLRGYWLSKSLSKQSQQQRTELFTTLSQLVAGGKLKMDIDSVFPMEEIQAAVARAEQPGRSGKIIVLTSAFPGGSNPVSRIGEQPPTLPD